MDQIAKTKKAMTTTPCFAYNRRSSWTVLRATQETESIAKTFNFIVYFSFLRSVILLQKINEL